MIQTERQLAALATALIGISRKKKASVAEDVLDSTRGLIAAGEDPLGDMFCRIRPARNRRATGATYTPSLIVKAMIAWAAGESEKPLRVVDPGAGSGRYLMAAADRFPTAHLVAIETDPLAAHLLRANAAVRGFANRLTVKLTDYRGVRLPSIDGPTLFIGNPPYVRHHDIAERWKAWFAESAAQYGFRASKLAGLHIHFFVRTRQLARPGDFGAFITAAEWMDVNYGSVLRRMLADGLGGTALHVIDPRAHPFADALTTGAVTCFRVGSRPDRLTVRSVNSLAQLAPLSQGKAIDWEKLREAPRWSVFLRGERRRNPDHVELGELFRVHRGQVTGSNEIWIENSAMQGMPARYLRGTVTRARELIGAGGALHSLDGLRRVLDLPVDLGELTKSERRVVERFLGWARSREVQSGYVASHRRAWWSVALRDPAPILCTYMARSAPTFVRNFAGARHLNIAHGLYPRIPLSERALAAILVWLRGHVGTAGGRVYAGGLVKFEPKELERIPVPTLENIHAAVSEEMERSRTDRRRDGGHRRVSPRAS